jgi:para-aminobenzoate synthetase component I
MMTFGPLVPDAGVRLFGTPPGAPATCLGRLWERSRIEWRLGDPGDPSVLVTEFLGDHGLAVGDLARPGRAHDPGSTICGAALFFSAAAGAHLVRARVEAPSPAATIPDVVAVVYGHGPVHPGGPRTTTRGQLRPWRLGTWQPSWSPAGHAEAVRAVRASIAYGDVYQVNLVGHTSAPRTGDPTAALTRVVGLPGARYGGSLAGAGWALACASPETLVEVVAGRAVTRPIKGTRPATGTGRAELLGSAKERAEHVMIVDLERNDLSLVARTGTVRVDELYAIRRWCDLWQAESVVSAELAAGVGLAELLAAVCPGGSVTGAPKLAALDILAKLEPVGRGPSMGALGWVATDRIDLGLTIRTVAVEADRVHVWAGGGITWGSDPAAEVAEAEAKAAPLRAALAGPADMASIKD